MLIILRKIVPVIVLMALLMTSCSQSVVKSPLPRSSTLPATQGSVRITPQLPQKTKIIRLTSTPSETQRGSSTETKTGKLLEPCKLITTAEVRSLLGSIPTAKTNNVDPNDRSCEYRVDTGLLTIDVQTNPQAAIEFLLATSHLNQSQGYKSIKDQGVSIAVYGSNNADGNGTPGFVAYLNNGDILVMIRIYSKTYTYNSDKALALLENVGEQLR